MSALSRPLSRAIACLALLALPVAASAVPSIASDPARPYHTLMACHFAQMHFQMAVGALKKNTVAGTRQLARNFQAKDPLMRIASPDDRVAIGRLVDQIINAAAKGQPDRAARELCPSVSAYAASNQIAPALHTAGCIQQVRLMGQIYDKAKSMGGGQKGIHAVITELRKPQQTSPMWVDLERRGLNPRLLTQMSLALANQLLPVESDEDLAPVTQALVQQCKASGPSTKGAS